MATKADLRRMLLAHLTVIDATGSIPAEMGSLADLWIDGARAQLLEKGLCWWDENDIPAAVTIPLTQYVGAKACRAFGRLGKGYEADEAPALQQLAGLKSSEERPTATGRYY